MHGSHGEAELETMERNPHVGDRKGGNRCLAVQKKKTIESNLKELEYCFSLTALGNVPCKSVLKSQYVVYLNVGLISLSFHSNEILGELFLTPLIDFTCPPCSTLLHPPQCRDEVSTLSWMPSSITHRIATGDNILKGNLIGETHP